MLLVVPIEVGRADYLSELHTTNRPRIVKILPKTIPTVSECTVNTARMRRVPVASASVKNHASAIAIIVTAISIAVATVRLMGSSDANNAVKKASAFGLVMLVSRPALNDSFQVASDRTGCADTATERCWCFWVLVAL